MNLLWCPQSVWYKDYEVIADELVIARSGKIDIDFFFQLIWSFFAGFHKKKAKSKEKG